MTHLQLYLLANYFYLHIICIIKLCDAYLIKSSTAHESTSQRSGNYLLQRSSIPGSTEGEQCILFWRFYTYKTSITNDETQIPVSNLNKVECLIYEIRTVLWVTYILRNTI